MHPYLLRFTAPWGGEITIASYGAMMMIGFLASLYVLQRRAGKFGVSSEKIFNVAIAMLVFGVIGARLFFVIQFWNDYEFAANPLLILRIDRGGLVFYGGLIGGLAGALALIKKQNLPLADTFGLIASAGPLGHAFGRLGCFLNGCCYGEITTSAIGLRFPRILDSEQRIVGSQPFLDHLNRYVEQTDAWSMPVHATQLYEVGYNLFIFALLSLLLVRRNRPSELIGPYLIIYGTARFINEIFRADTRAVAMGLTIAQLLCIPLVLAGGVAMIIAYRTYGRHKS